MRIEGREGGALPTNRSSALTGSRPYTARFRPVVPQSSKCRSSKCQLPRTPPLDSSGIRDARAVDPPNDSRRSPWEETINDPTNPTHYWRYRQHVTLDQLLEDDDFIGDVQEILYSSGRIAIEDIHEFWSLRGMGLSGNRRNSYPGTIQSIPEVPRPRTSFSGHMVPSAAVSARVIDVGFAPGSGLPGSPEKPVQNGERTP